MKLAGLCKVYDVMGVLIALTSYYIGLFLGDLGNKPAIVIFYLEDGTQGLATSGHMIKVEVRET